MLQFVSVFIICQKLHYWELLTLSNEKILDFKVCSETQKLFNISRESGAKSLKTTVVGN